MVQGGADESQDLLTNQFDYIFFTGSTRIGKLVIKASAQYLTPITLELGGKSPCIVHNDANLKVSAARIVWGKFFNAGQSCIAPDYLLVHQDIKQPLLKHLQQQITAFYGDNPATSNDYARMANQQQYDRLAHLLEDCTIVTGGQKNRDDLYIAPTVVDNVSLNHPLMRDEIFGPILPILTYKTIDEALEIVNKQPRALGVYIFSSNKKIQDIILEKTSSGGACINDVMIQAGSPHLPFGGVGLSGFGRYHGNTGFKTFSNVKSVVKNGTWLDVPLRYAPYGKLHQWVKKLLRWKS